MGGKPNKAKTAQQERLDELDIAGSLTHPIYWSTQSIGGRDAAFRRDTTKMIEKNEALRHKLIARGTMLERTPLKVLKIDAACLWMRPHWFSFAEDKEEESRFHVAYPSIFIAYEALFACIGTNARTLTRVELTNIDLRIPRCKDMKKSWVVHMTKAFDTLFKAHSIQDFVFFLNYEEEDDFDFEPAFKSLPKNQSLIKFKVGGTQLHPRNTLVTYVAQLLEKNTPLKELDLYGCALKDDAAFILANALEKNRRVERLQLGRNDFNTYGAQALHDALCTNLTLRFVSLLGDHEKTQDLAYQILRALDVNKALWPMFKLVFCAASCFQDCVWYQFPRDILGVVLIFVKQLLITDPSVTLFSPFSQSL